jgi:hypothetical protein
VVRREILVKAPKAQRRPSVEFESGSHFVEEMGRRPTPTPTDGAAGLNALTFVDTKAYSFLYRSLE